MADAPDQSVLYPEGSTSVTWIPNSATSCDSDWLRPSSAHFDAWYMPVSVNALMPPMLETCTMCPDPCSRMIATAACVIQSAPNTLVSNWPRASSSVISSIAPNWPKPALLTTTSSEPKRSAACCTAAMPASRSVTSSRRGSTASPCRSTSASRAEVSRAVAATRSPRSSAASAHSRPKPLDAPVMNHVFMGMSSRRYPSANVVRGPRMPRIPGSPPQARSADTRDGIRPPSGPAGPPW